MVSRFQIILCLFLGCSSVACGEGSSNTSRTSGTPVLKSLSPTSVSAGNTVSLQGIGFSPNPNENIVWVGGASTVSQNYSVLEANSAAALGASEQIQFQVPAGLAAGTASVFVWVGEDLSNSLNLTILAP